MQDLCQEEHETLLTLELHVQGMQNRTTSKLADVKVAAAHQIQLSFPFF